jgi:hypothetical protein
MAPASGNKYSKFTRQRLIFLEMTLSMLLLVDFHEDGIMHALKDMLLHTLLTGS